MSRTLSGLFLVGALNRLRKRKRTNRENPRTIPEQIGKIPEKSGKSQKGQKRTKKEGHVQIGKPPRLKHPRLAALEFISKKRFTRNSLGWAAQGFVLFFIGAKTQHSRVRQDNLSPIFRMTEKGVEFKVKMWTRS